MESVASNSPSPDHNHQHDHHHRFRPTQPIADRIVRALRHRLHLLHRSDAKFYVLGVTGNVYTVTLSAAPWCTCPDRTTPCKHILFVFLRVLRLSTDDTCLRRRTLRPCQLSRLLGAPMSLETLAGARARERFHELFSHLGSKNGPNEASPPRVELEDGATCPVCLEEMVVDEEKVVACGTCRNALHEECLVTWRRSRGRRSATCVICRARWRGRVEKETYLNLAAYVDDQGDQMVEGQGLCGD